MVEEQEATDDKGWEETQEQYEGGEGEGVRGNLRWQAGGPVDHEALWPHHLHVLYLKIIWC